MSPDFRDVLAFHLKYELPCAHSYSPMTPDQLAFRLRFLNEEREEFLVAIDGRDLVKAVDALIDFVYVALGTALFIGVPRSGEISSWPTFSGTTARLLAIGARVPKRPELCDAHRVEIFSALSAAHIHAFKSAHNLAATREAGDGSILALETLRAMIRAAYATAAMMGTPWPKCWSYVQMANMSKVRARRDGSDSKRGTSWDVVKPQGWQAPDVAIRAELLRAGATL
jgi:predicted HAD superfamily Cof-like phosphohydrolase